VTKLWPVYAWAGSSRRRPSLLSVFESKLGRDLMHWMVEGLVCSLHRCNPPKNSVVQAFIVRSRALCHLEGFSRPLFFNHYSELKHPASHKQPRCRDTAAPQYAVTSGTAGKHFRWMMPACCRELPQLAEAQYGKPPHEMLLVGCSSINSDSDPEGSHSATIPVNEQLDRVPSKSKWLNIATRGCPRVKPSWQQYYLLIEEVAERRDGTQSRHAKASIPSLCRRINRDTTRLGFFTTVRASALLSNRQL
jgi:hypothetical protein